MNRLSGKTAVITGGSSGLGLAITRRMAEEGAAVVILDRDTQGQAVADAICSTGGKALFVQGDVTDEARVCEAMRITATHFGGIDILVNNAGIEGENTPTDRLSLAEWNRVMAVDVTAVFLCSKHAIPHLRTAGGGAIINISSIYGIVGGGDIPPYHAAKGAVRTMTKNDALLYASERIRVNSIHPGFVFTPLVDRYVHDNGLAHDAAKAHLDALHPLGGTGTPDDIAWGAVYLASDEARWVTGAELVIDGGYTAR
ncbi:SDR family NAD(P)-dependent oxidoreductase [Zoogloea sp.]|uniref:SDR family NAD(P)-dependent oxidoreductase n=1 Tax=Zoogloea sp. TaxID=49181 RepID=UPI0025E194BB|nr:SDR family oxidoreductase [Zoogloea sp.]MCK6395629.1 SDR family oxidoreductase [Zoogloea sp.]